MAALCIALRYRLLVGSLRQSPWAVVALVLSVLGALSLLGSSALGAVAIRVLVPELGAHAAVLAGAALTVGLTAIAVLVGTSDPLAPERFSLLPVRVPQLRRGLLAASLLDPWGAVAVLAVAIGLIVWSTSAAALVAGALLLPVAVLTVLLITRVIADLLARQLASRRARDVMALLLLVAIAAAALGMQSFAAGVGELGDAAPVVADASRVVGWTPLGAVFDVPRAVAAGAWPEAAAKLAIALATVALSWWAWGRMLAERLTNPIVLRGGGRVREGRLLDRLLPATPAGAIAARSIRYRRRDVRHLMNVIAVLIVPAMIAGLQLVADEVPREPIALLPLLMAVVAASMLQIDVAYDSSAFAWHLLAGVRGVDDRAGRLLGTSVVFVPALAITAVLACWAAGRWDVLPASLAVGVGTYGLVGGALLWLGAYLPGEAPPPGSNPLGRGSSGGVQSLAGVALSLPVLGIAGAPFLLPAVAALWIPWLGWVALAAALLIGGLASWLGIRLGGAALDRRGPEVLAQVSKAH
ncbi:hypothetical protein [Agrococcus sp. SCSIO52902]|uniref:hypothetical protein n=1 Tax=Agrococcus sp. SCSIO52902 TaxID=2933290 RepID=UPI001FF4A378|nr:hypothetical protein [Agrococcus sp. SCSIO52902]UOW00959.1 hypothetical protein MU522_00585 [Agrococcus sp. SCSIO52902]